MTTWSQSFPGVVTPGCRDATGAFEVHHETGRQLRIMGEARLCFRCGPDGGVYHPDLPGIRFLVKQAAATPDEARRIPKRLPRSTCFEYVRDIAAIYDKVHNQFRTHRHHTFLEASAPGGPRRDGPDIEHAHTDGGDAHKHPETGPAYFLGSKDRARPYGPEFDLVELSEAQRTFRVVLTYKYINAGVWDGKKNTSISRADWRRSMELYVWTIRMQALGNTGYHPYGPGAIPMTTNRLIANLGLTPIYEIRGWKPTPWTGLP
jgi:hypothetical protein